MLSCFDGLDLVKNFGTLMKIATRAFKRAEWGPIKYEYDNLPAQEISPWR